jgi:hypothetical protein
VNGRQHEDASACRLRVTFAPVRLAFHERVLMSIFRAIGPTPVRRHKMPAARRTWVTLTMLRRIVLKKARDGSYIVGASRDAH